MTQDELVEFALSHLNGSTVVEDHFHELYQHFIDVGEMPYGESRPAGFDPHDWIEERLSDIGRRSLARENNSPFDYETKDTDPESPFGR